MLSSTRTCLVRIFYNSFVIGLIVDCLSDLWNWIDCRLYIRSISDLVRRLVWTEWRSVPQFNADCAALGCSIWEGGGAVAWPARTSSREGAAQAWAAARRGEQGAPAAWLPKPRPDFCSIFDCVQIADFFLKNNWGLCGLWPLNPTVHQALIRLCEIKFLAQTNFLSNVNFAFVYLHLALYKSRGTTDIYFHVVKFLKGLDKSALS